MDVVVVESPTKARSINKYLGSGYRVLSSYGHVRDLPEKDGSVLPDEDFRIIYELLADREKRVAEIARALKDAKHLYLATDPDREGEAISWHLLAALKERDAIDGVDVKRVVFHEITRRAVLEAMRHPRDLHDGLIDAYQARRALDYLVGFTLSPVLWRKLQGSRSAGRVQSVALRLICEREAEIEAFRPQEYWSIQAAFTTPQGAEFAARLSLLDGKKLEKFGLAGEADARRAIAAIEARGFRVESVEKKQVQRHPAPPFATATLQQEASRKLGFGADRTMRTAQRLFEGVNLNGETVGLITYMRTDSVQLSGEALAACRRQIAQAYGERYLPDKPRAYRTRTKNAQEAHEAIRPTDLGRTPQAIGRLLEDDQRRLYELIWKRTMASQMASAVLDRVVADLASADQQVGFRATGSTVAFDGFLKLYQEGRDDPAQDDDDGGLLPPMAPGDPLRRGAITPKQHFTEPPPRYTEASLVRKLEELGIGRPSTYASIISVLQDRNYVRLESRRFVPEDRGRLVTAFLVAFFDQYVQPGFTAYLEDQLDDVAAGARHWKQVLREFWDPFSDQVDEVKERRVAEVIDALNELLAPHLFPPRDNGADPRACPLCGDGRLSLKLGRFGAFVGCSNYPECRFTRRLGMPAADGEEKPEAKERPVGVDPESGEEIRLRHGPYGPYVQRGQGEAARRSSLPPNLPADRIDLEIARKLLALPRALGKHPETGQPIEAGINRYGPYIKHERFVRLGPDDDVLSIGMNRAMALLEDAGSKARPAPKVLKELGPHPKDKKPVVLYRGRFGPYLKHGKQNASLRKGHDPDTLTLEQAVTLLQEKAAKGKGKATAGGKAAPNAARRQGSGAKTLGGRAAKSRS
ncbi:MAG: type I DNA topoisomerase [Geminicoccaceae bacterium]